MNSPPPAVLPPKKFRRGQRVRRAVAHAQAKYDAETGTVLNPDFKSNWNLSVRSVTVRWDSQDAYEKGRCMREDDLSADSTGETQFEKRQYCLRWLSHGEIALLREALEKVSVRNDTLTDEGVQAMLKKLPELPS